MSGIVGYGIGPKLGRGLSGYVVNTDENWSFKTSAWVLLSLYLWPSFFRGDTPNFSLRLYLTYVHTFLLALDPASAITLLHIGRELVCKSAGVRFSDGGTFPIPVFVLLSYMPAVFGLQVV